MHYRVVLAAFSLGIVAVFCGVGGDDPLRISVGGTISLYGKPLESGAVRFILKSYADQPHVDVSLVKDGKYAIAGSDLLVPGTYQVQIRSDAQDGIFRGRKQDIAGLPADQRVRIPARYNDQSVLEVEIPREGLSRFDFELRN
jgi:hypothetical protein